MTGAFGYTVAIVIAALALRRMPVELARWRIRRRGRLLDSGSRPSRPGERPEQLAVSSRTRQGQRQSTAKPAQSSGRLRRRLRRALDDAAVRTSESQAVAIWGVAVGVGMLGGLVLASAPGAAVGAAAGLLGMPAALWAARRRRARLIAEALPEFLERVARSLRAGVSTVAAVEENCPAAGPLGADVGSVVADVRAGRPLEVALASWHTRCSLPEVNLATAALSIGASTGGRRAPAVDGVAATLREARAAQRDLASLAQQGRLSGLLIALLPLCFLGLSALVDSGSVTALYGTSLGLVCLALGTALNLVALVWMHRITRLP